MFKKTYTIAFRKMLADQGDGVIITPPTKTVKARIEEFCKKHEITILRLNILSPFEISEIQIIGSRNERDMVFDFLVQLQHEHLFSTVYKGKSPKKK